MILHIYIYVFTSYVDYLIGIIIDVLLHRSEAAYVYVHFILTLLSSMRLLFKSVLDNCINDSNLVMLERHLLNVDPRDNFIKLSRGSCNDAYLI